MTPFAEACSLTGFLVIFINYRFIIFYRILLASFFRPSTCFSASWRIAMTIAHSPLTTHLLRLRLAMTMLIHYSLIFQPGRCHTLNEMFLKKKKCYHYRKCQHHCGSNLNPQLTIGTSPDGKQRNQLGHRH